MFPDGQGVSDERSDEEMEGEKEEEMEGEKEEIEGEKEEMEGEKEEEMEGEKEEDTVPQRNEFPGNRNPGGDRGWRKGVRGY